MLVSFVHCKFGILVCLFVFFFLNDLMRLRFLHYPYVIITKINKCQFSFHSLIIFVTFYPLQSNSNSNLILNLILFISKLNGRLVYFLFPAKIINCSKYFDYLYICIYSLFVILITLFKKKKFFFCFICSTRIPMIPSIDISPFKSRWSYNQSKTKYSIIFF